MGGPVMGIANLLAPSMPRRFQKLCDDEENRLRY
jgi:hypothetical protein